MKRSEAMTASMASRTVAALLAASVLLLAAPAQADEAVAEEGGAGALAAVASLVYGPVKLAYATGGIVFGGIAWALSGGDDQVMSAVITPAVRGDYVITPAVIRGERKPVFLGKDPRYEETELAQAELYDPALLLEEEY